MAQGTAVSLHDSGALAMRYLAAPVALLSRDLDIAGIVRWITAIDFAEWPQQNRLDRQLRPAMVTDPDWHDFRIQTDAVVQSIMVQQFGAVLPPSVGAYQDYNRMLSVVMPGHCIVSHRDAQEPDWVGRVHVPLVTNPSAFFVADGTRHHLEVGFVYLVDTRVEHEVQNDGTTPRIHLMFDVRRSA